MTKAALIILDGWGIGDGSKSDAICKANTPFFDCLIKHYPNTTLKTYGHHVGLPDRQMGNSEVGHLNIGAGRVVNQELLRINTCIEDKRFFKIEKLNSIFQKAIKNNKTIHLIGLLSDGGVHSHIDHLFALIDLLNELGAQKVSIHPFLDGRDTDPKSGLGFLERLEEKIKHTPFVISTLMGRYYAMDRDKRWERTTIAYQALINGVGENVNNIKKALLKKYENQESDEFIKPIILQADKQDNHRIQDKDAVIFFNFRTDRPRQITTLLTQKNTKDTQKLDLDFITFTMYDERFKNIDVLFEKETLSNTLGEVIANKNLSQLRAAETEKYPHVTFFFSGGIETSFKNEERILVPSPKVTTYDLAPRMSADELTQKTILKIKEKAPDFICLNYANPDMVGHTGVYKAIIEAIECVDENLKKLVNTLKEQAYEILIIADHGNADFTINSDGSPNTAHTTNLVPAVLVSDTYKEIKNGNLANIAPTILKLMEIEKPSEITADSLI